MEQNKTEDALKREAYLKNGLSEEEVTSRTALGQTNAPVSSTDETLKDIIFENVFTYFNLIFAIIAVCLIMVGSFRDLTFLPIIIANTLIGIIQEWRSKKLLDRLTIVSTPKCTVIRSGKQGQVPASDLVREDLILLDSGMQIPADAVVEEGELTANEALLTGEADEITKRVGDELLSGSYVVSGACKARLVRVGAESYSSQLTLEAKKRRKEEQSEMIRSLDRLVKIVGIVIVPIAIILFWQQRMIAKASLRDSVTGTVAAILGMIPEGLYLLASVAMAVSAMRLAMGRVLIHNMKSIETLARADVLCVDKTGTITENSMTVKEVLPMRVPASAFSRPARITDQAETAAAGPVMQGRDAMYGTVQQTASMTGIGYEQPEETVYGPAQETESRSGARYEQPSEAVYESAQQTDGQTATGYEQPAEAMYETAQQTVGQSDIGYGQPEDTVYGSAQNITGQSGDGYGQPAAGVYGTAQQAAQAAGFAQQAAQAAGFTQQAAGEQEEILDSYAMEDTAALELTIGDFAACMSNDNITMKAIKTRFSKQTGKRPERIFPFSPMYKYSGAVFGRNRYVLGAPEFILRTDYPIYAEQIEKYTMVGYRVLVFGLYQGELTGEALTAKVIPMGLILLMNPVRQGAAETFRYFERQGVTVKVISGDNPMTVSEVAMEAGIPGAEHYVDASALDEEDMQNAVREYTVFGRVTPQQKRQLIAALKKNGHTVAMTGDGVNDVLALKDADCSIAMASGSDAAAHAAQMVLLESDFSRMPAVVSEGRRVVNNIERTASLFLVKNIFSLLLSVFSIIFMLNYPLEPSQISLIGMFTIGIPAFVMSLETNTGQIKGHFLSNVFFKALPAGLTDFLIISALVLFCREFHVSDADLSTSATVVLAIVGIMILYRIASPMTRMHWILWIAMICGLLFCMVFMNRIFAIHSLSRKSGMLLVMFAIITEPLLRYLSLLIRKIWQLVAWARAKLKERREAQEKLFAEMQ